LKNKIDPATLGLHARTVVERLGANHLTLVKDRKSRIIMSDGRKILQQAEIIKGTYPNARISLKTSAPICNKTRAFLKERGIEVLPL
jgi:hypothetical protein